MRSGGFAIAAMVVACSSERVNPTILTDEDGNVFAWECPATGCTFDTTSTSPQLPSDCPSGSRWGWVAGHFFDVCYFEPSSSGFLVFQESCRAAKCYVDDDCPYAAFGEGLVFTCEHNLCQSQAAMTQRDVESLCWPSRPTTCDITATETSTTFQQITAMLPPCTNGADCTVPAGCRQP